MGRVFVLAGGPLRPEWPYDSMFRQPDGATDPLVE